MIVGVILQNLGGIFAILGFSFVLFIIIKNKKKENKEEFTDKTIKNHKRYHL